MVKKESDFWIWITPQPSQLERLLLSDFFPAKTKYKLGLSFTPSSDLVVRSVCFFCAEGLPQIVDFPPEGPPSFNYFPNFVLNLMGKTLRISFPAVKARIEATPPYKGVNNANRGMLKTLFDQYLMVKLNFTYNMFLSTGGGGTGLELPNGTWIGTVGDVVSGKADMAIMTGNTNKRNQQVSFTKSFFDVSYLHFITTNGVRIFSPATLLWSFDLLMWTCIGASTLGAFIVFKLITKSMTVLGMDGGERMTFAHRGIISKESWRIEHQIFFVINSYLDQDCVLPTYTPLRCFVAMWLFFVLIVTTVYRSKMVSLLAFPVLEKIPTTFEELVESDYTVGFIKHGDGAYNTMKASTDPVYVKLVKDMEIITGVGLECLENVVEKKYACLAFTISTLYLLYGNLSDSDTRKLMYSPEKTYVVFLGAALEPGSIYKESFDFWLSWVRPFHLADFWEAYDMHYNVRLPKRAWWLSTNQTDKLERSDPGESDDLTLKHISGAFYALGACLVFSGVVFIQELVAFHYMARMKRKIVPLIRIIIPERQESFII
ncbi:glutamate receptor ionotropic, delta-1 [Folsomia candida]|nr:glutamate receptor ionotropic, delta-1 [Folsomia candida]